MDSLCEDENNSEIESIRLLNTALEADKCDKNTVISSQHSLGSVSTVTATQSDSTLTNRIETALAFNRIMEEKLRRLESIFVNRLQECKEKLKNVQSEIPNLLGVSSKFRYVVCGRPYFKDSNYFQGPDNSDTITMQQSGMYNLSTVSSLSGWTCKDKRLFSNAILKLTKKERRKEIESKIVQLKRNMQEVDIKDYASQIQQLKDEQEELDTKSLSNIAYPIDHEYDWDLISHMLKYRHKPNEYHAMWKLYLHPSVNKADWSREEQENLLILAEKNGFRNWEATAKELNTNRTAYQCFVFYKTNILRPPAGQKWTKEEEEYLKRVIELYRDGNYIPWPKVAAKFGNRTKMQIYGKYIRMKDQKGRFLKEEDDVLLTCISKFGLDFNKIADEYLVNRTKRQLQSRYARLREAKRVSTVWTVEEDRRLVQLMSNKEGGTNFADIVEHFPGKCRTSLRTRYKTLEKWMGMHPRMDISKAPRRGVRRLGHGGVVKDLTSAVKKLKEKLTTECRRATKQKLSQLSTEHEIDDAITTALMNETLEQEEIERNDFTNYVDEADAYLGPVAHSSQNLSNLLIVLRAKLNRNVFVKSLKWTKKFPNLLGANVSPIKRLSFYSKKKDEPAKDVPVSSGINIWGNAFQDHSDFILPPHFSTIAGLRKLMQYVIDVKRNHDTTNQCCRKNADFRKQYDLLSRRFRQLFMWPMILSNNHPVLEVSRPTNSEPPESILSTVDPLPSVTKKRKVEAVACVAIPKIKKCTNSKHKFSDDPNFQFDEDYKIILKDNLQKSLFNDDNCF